MKRRTIKSLALGMALASALAVVPSTVSTPDSYADVIESKQDSSSVKVSVGSNFTVTIPKQIILSVDNTTLNGTGQYKVGVHGDINYNTSIYVVPQSQFDMSNGEDTVSAKVSQDKTEFVWSEILEDTTWGNGSVLAESLSAGDWEGIFYFNIDAQESGSQVGAPGTNIEDGKEYNLPLSINIENGCSVTINGEPVDVIDNTVTITEEGSYTIVITNGSGDSVTFNITVIHNHIYVDGFCNICDKKDPDYVVPEHNHSYSNGVCPTCHERVAGLYTVSGTQLCDWQTLVDAGLGIETDYAVSSVESNFNSGWSYYFNNNCQYTLNKSSVNPNQVKCIVVIDDSVTTIGSHAFYSPSGGLDLLAGIDIPDSVVSISYGAFEGIKSMKDIYIPSSVKKIFGTDSGFSEILPPFNNTDIKIYTGVDNPSEVYGEDWDNNDYHSNVSSQDKATVLSGYSRKEYFCEKVGHTYDEFPVNATCTETGKVVYTCSKCNHTYETIVKALGHTFGDTVTVKEPTCSVLGESYKMCEVCGFREEVSIPTLAHNYVTGGRVDSTCEKRGYIYKVCENCGSEAIQSYLNVIDHIYNDDNACVMCGTTRPSAEDSIIYNGSHVTGYTDYGHYKSITIKEGTTHIDANALKNINCDEIILPSSIESIGSYSVQSLYVCKVVVPAEVKVVSNNAFFNVGTVIYDGALNTSNWGCWSTNGYYEDGFTFSSDSKDYLVKCSPNLKGTIVIPETVVEIRKNAISNNENVKNIVVNSGCVTVDSQSFGYNFGLETLYIPSTLSSVPGAGSGFSSMVGGSINVKIYCESDSVSYVDGWDQVNSKTVAPKEYGVSLQDYLSIIGE